MPDKDIEQEIQEKGLTAPRVTPQHIESLIRSEVFSTGTDGAQSPSASVKSEYVEGERILAPLDLLTFCVLVLLTDLPSLGKAPAPVRRTSTRKSAARLPEKTQLTKYGCLKVIC